MTDPKADTVAEWLAVERTAVPCAECGTRPRVVPFPDEGCRERWTSVCWKCEYEVVSLTLAESVARWNRLQANRPNAPPRP